MKNSLKKFFNKYRESSVVFRAGIWFLLVTVIDKGIAVLTQPFINRILSVEQVGVFGVYNSWHSIFSVLATLNLFGGVLEIALTKESENKNAAVQSLCSLSLVTSFVFTGICLIFLSKIAGLLGIKPIYLVFMLITIISDMVIQFWIVPKRFEYSYKKYAFVVVSLFFIKSVVSVLLAYFMESDRVLGRILGLSVPTLLYAVVIGCIVFRKAKLSKITSHWKQGLKFNIPLIPHYLATILLASSDRFMLKILVGDAQAGLYTVAYSYASLSLIVFGALNNIYNPYSMKCIAEERYQPLARSTSFLVFASVLFSILMMLLAPEGMLILGGEQYAETVYSIPILMVGIFFSSFYFIFSNIEFVYEKTKLIFPITLGGAIVNIVLNYIFIPKYGYMAAAVTTLVGYIIVAACHYLVGYKILKKNIYDIKMILAYLAILGLGAVLATFLYGVNPIIRYVVTGATMALAVLYFVKNKNKLRG